MVDRHQLGRKSPGSALAARWLGFLLAVIVGVLVGFKLWQIPEGADAGLQGSSPMEGLPVLPAPSATVWVPDQGRLKGRLTTGVRIGSRAPEFTLADLAGEEHALSKHLGSVVLINFWTTWCPPCKYEMPALQQAFEMFQGSRFTVLAVNWTQQDDPAQVAPFVQALGLTFPVLLDRDGGVSEGLFNIRGLPTSVIVDKNGIVREIIIGPIDLDNLESKIQSYLLELP